MPGGKFLLVMGTRPEVIKLTPVYFALEGAGALVQIVFTNQQNDLALQAMKIFDLASNYFIQPSEHYSPNLLLSHLVGHFPIKCLQNTDFIVVQGDTTSALAGTLTAFYAGIKIAHVEAGLMTGDLSGPFPEEGHRRMISQIATLNFAPTPTAKANLQELGASGIHVTGNTVVDALELVEKKDPGINGQYVLITLHRRESFGAQLRGMLGAIKELSEKYLYVKFVLSVHPNPNVREAIHSVLGTGPVQLLDPPPDYGRWVNLMRGAYFIMTDSGGIQEEAPSFGVPVLVLRDKTERPEAVYLGYSQLVGTDANQIFKAVSWLLNNESARNKMVAKLNPFGDGRAGQRIAEILMEAVGERIRILQAV